MTRVVAVLGYSDGRGRDLHPVCRARLAHAARIVRDGDVVVLTGWSRRSRHLSEAALMAREWPGPTERLVLDPRARSTRGNARHSVAAAREAGVQEIVVVTSGWHGRRALALFRRATKGTGIGVSLDATADTGPVSARLRELACLAAVPLS